VSKPVPEILTPKVEPPAVVELDWAALIQKLDMIREPISAAADGSEPTDQGTTPVPEQPPAFIALNWQYEGYVAEGDSLIALVRISSIQRFVFVDQEIKDPSIPGLGRATIKSITPEEIVVMVGDHEVTVQRTTQAQTNELIRAQPATAGRIE